MTRALLLLTLCGAVSQAEIRTVALPGKSPLVTLRFVFTTGAAADPAGRPGVAHLTAEMLGNGGTKAQTYKQIVDAMYPMATEVRVYSDKEMTTFVGETHRDNLDKFYGLMRDMILHPGWRQDDFTRIRDESVNALRVSLRGNNDEELGKEVLYNVIYGLLPYGHENLGTVSSLQRMTVNDLEAFYRGQYVQSKLIVGIAGGYPPEFVDRIKRDFSVLPERTPPPVGDTVELGPGPIKHTHVTLVEKDTRSVAWSLGYPLDVERGDPDYPAMLLVQSWLGQHRESVGRLYNRMRELRGLNYGDYAYIEYFPRGMFRMEPEPNIARHQQIFQIWIRPVEPPNAVFALRLALFELDRLVKNGIPDAEFEKTRSFLSKFVNILTKTKSAELGYAIDSLYYGIPNYGEYVRSGLAKLTAAEVNAAIRRHLRTDRIEIVGIAKDTDAIRAALTGTDPSPMHYNSPKAQDVLDEDKIVERFPLGLRKEDVTVVPVNTVFEN